MIEKPIIIKDSNAFPAGATFIDAYESALFELFLTRNPQFKKGMPQVEAAFAEFRKTANIPEAVVYYPWRNVAIRIVDEATYFELRTARNKHAIPQEEQLEYRAAKVGIAGLSVGSAVVAALVTSGGPKVLKIADFDTLEISNLNRIRAGLPDFGANKTHLAARSVWELDPFAELTLWEKGVTMETFPEFVGGNPAIDIFIDEMDNIALKMFAREFCRAQKIPVIMATDNGDNVILDVERFDLEPNRPIFHGLVEDMKQEELSNLDFKKWVELATKIVGPEYLTPSMQKSISEIGRSIAAVPQLGTTAGVAGAATAYAVRKIAHKGLMPSGRYIIDIEKSLSYAVI